MTNADYIRKMDDERLFHFLDAWSLGDIDYAKTFSKKSIDSLLTGLKNCEDCEPKRGRRQTMIKMNYSVLLREWTKRLGLTDWRIKVKHHCSPDDMPTVGEGCVDFTESTKCAMIYIIDPVYYGERIIPFDGEEILVHELLHLKLALIQDVKDDLQERYVHQLLDDLARAMVDAKRGGKG